MQSLWWSDCGSGLDHCAARISIPISSYFSVHFPLSEPRFRNSFIYTNAEKRWTQSQSEAEEELKRINVLIRDYNLIAPTMDRQFMQLRMDRERETVEADVAKDFEQSELVRDTRQTLIREHHYRMSSGGEGGGGFLKNILGSF